MLVKETNQLSLNAKGYQQHAVQSHNWSSHLRNLKLKLLVPVKNRKMMFVPHVLKVKLFESSNIFLTSFKNAFVFFTLIMKSDINLDKIADSQPAYKSSKCGFKVYWPTWIHYPLLISPILFYCRVHPWQPKDSSSMFP